MTQRQSIDCTEILNSLEITQMLQYEIVLFYQTDAEVVLYIQI